MKHFRNLFFSSFSFLLLISTVHSEVFALTSEQEARQVKTCRELQDVANKIKWNVPTTFQGFENLPVNTKPYRYGPGENDYQNNGNDRLCQLGYITTISPMGKEVCKGHLYVNVKSRFARVLWGYAYMSTDINSPRYRRSSFCRYVN